MSDLGSDFDCGSDFKPDMLLLDTDAGKVTAYLQAIARRLQTPRGALFYDLDYGLDLRSYIADDEDPVVAAHEINQECKKDERTATASTTISVNADSSWTIATTVGTDDGKTYTLTLAVGLVSVALLSTVPN